MKIPIYFSGTMVLYGIENVSNFRNLVVRQAIICLCVINICPIPVPTVLKEFKHANGALI